MRSATFDLVLDASALLVLLWNEPGGAALATELSRACICSVNLAEVAGKLADRGLSPADTAALLIELPLMTLSFDRDLALRAGALRPSTAARGLSLGDRACLALAQREGLPALTADRAWSDLDIGVEIRLVR